MASEKPHQRSSKRFLIERGPGFRSGLRDLPKHLNAATIGAGVIAAIFGCTGPALIVINGAQQGGLTSNETVSWIFGIYAFGGLISLLMALYYKLPIVGAFSIPGAVLVISGFGEFTFAELVGAFLAAGVIVLLIGLSGLIRQVANWIPYPIVMAMIAGALIRFGIGVVGAAVALPVVVISAIIGYILVSRLTKAIPGVIGALVFGVVAALISGSLNSVEGDIGLVAPALVAPQFSFEAILAIGLPLALLVIGAENAQAMGVLMAQKYNIPFNSMTIISGIGGLLAPLFGGHNANIAGPMTAICSSDQAGENKEGRYAAAVVNGVLFGAFGVFAGIAVVTVSILPSELTATLAGLAMIGVLLTAFQGSFGIGQFQVSALVALIIAMSQVTLLNISAPFWSLVGGVLTALLLEPKDFRYKEEVQPEFEEIADDELGDDVDAPKPS